MTDLPQPDLGGGANRLKTEFLRVLSSLAALAIILPSLVLPVMFMAVADELWEIIPVLGLVVLCWVAAYPLLRFAIKGPKPR